MTSSCHLDRQHYRDGFISAGYLSDWAYNYNPKDNHDIAPNCFAEQSLEATFRRPPSIVVELPHISGSQLRSRVKTLQVSTQLAIAQVSRY